MQRSSVGQTLCRLASHALLGSLHHHAQHGLGSRGTDQDPASAGERRLHGSELRNQARVGSPVRSRLMTHVEKYLGKQHDVLQQFGQGAPAASHRLQHLQRADDAVPGVVPVSYTPLTLPTTSAVSASVDALSQ